MTTKKIEVSPSLQAVYDNYYTDSLEEWREIGAKQKVENILDITKDQNFDRVLELGSGSGILLQKLSELNYAKQFYALDISESSIQQIKKKQIVGLASAETFDGYNIPYPDNYFDLVILSHVLEHVEHPRQFVREIKRVCKKAIIEVPRDYKPGVDSKWQALVSYGHINLYTPSLLRFFLKTEGFTILNDKMSFSSSETLLFKQTKASQILKIKCSILVRNLLYPLIPNWRKETMINAYTVLVTKM